MTKVEIIQMMANHYNEDNRSVDSGDCFYARDGKMCAVGMCMTDEAIDEFGDFMGTIHKLNAKILTEENKSFDAIFKDEYKGHDLNFWEELQYLHDECMFWDECGLTLEGHDKVEALIKAYSDAITDQ